MTLPEDRPVPTPEPQPSEPSRAWLGIVAVVFGALLMFAGVLSVYLYARKHPLPAPAPPVAAVPVPPLLTAPAPQPAPKTAPTASTREPEWPAPAAPGARSPFAEDALAPVPVQAGHPLWGPPDAPVTLTLFADLECPHTVPLVRAVLSEKARRGDKLRLAFRHLPLSQHDDGARTAIALAEIHGKLGEATFWRALSEIVRSGEPLGTGSLGPLLESVGAPGYPIEPPPAAAQRMLEEDTVLAVRLFVRSTPTLFVNGVRLEGFQTHPVLEETIARELRSAYLALANGSAKKDLYAERVRNNLLNIGDDPPERDCVPREDSPVRGAADPLLELVEFSDFECELCREGRASLDAVFRSHSSEIRHVWKNFPLPQHRRARLAASFALEARRAGGDSAFFTVAGALLERGAQPDEAGLRRAAERARLEPGSLLAAAESGAHEARIGEDLELGRKLGISGAPTYFVNGKKIAGALPAHELEAIVRAELALARRVRARGSGSVAELACETGTGGAR